MACFKTKDTKRTVRNLAAAADETDLLHRLQIRVFQCHYQSFFAQENLIALESQVTKLDTMISSFGDTMSKFLPAQIIKVSTIKSYKVDKKFFNKSFKNTSEESFPNEKKNYKNIEPTIFSATFSAIEMQSLPLLLLLDSASILNKQVVLLANVKFQLQKTQATNTLQLLQTAISSKFWIYCNCLCH